jgi:hypothetical protein
VEIVCIIDGLGANGACYFFRVLRQEQWIADKQAIMPAQHVLPRQPS